MKKYLALFLLCAASCVAQSPSILDNLEQQPFLTCGNCGNTNSSGATATYKVTTTSLPSRDGLSAAFAISAIGDPYANGYWYQKRYGTVSASNYEYEFDLLIPSQYADKPQAIEFEVQLNLAGATYNMAWQALNHGTKTWRYFDKINRRWVDMGIPVDLPPDTWHHIKAVFTTSTGKTTHVSLTVDGVMHPVNITQPSAAGTSRDYLSNAFQLDTDKYGDPYLVYVDKLTLKYW